MVGVNQKCVGYVYIYILTKIYDKQNLSVVDNQKSSSATVISEVASIFH